MSLHADALATLERYAPPAADDRQRALRDELIGHLHAHPDGALRSCLPDHLTAGLLVLDADLGAVLLNLHRKARRWFAFGGHLEPGDATLREAAEREGREESGLDALQLRVWPEPAQLDVHPVPFCAPGVQVRHLDVRYVAQAATGARPAVSDESLDVRWWPLDALPELEPSMHDLIATARRLLG